MPRHVSTLVDDGAHELLTLDELCARLRIHVATFYRREAVGYWQRHGLVELQRPAGYTRGSKRLFAAASVDRLIRHGGVRHVLSIARTA